MATKPTAKKVSVKLVRSIYVSGVMVPALQPAKGKDPEAPTVISVPAQLAAELVANSKAVLAADGEKPNHTVVEATEEDDFADVK